MFARDVVLLSIDLQQWLDHPARGRRNNPTAERNVARLLTAWRACGLPVVHVRHDAPELASMCHSSQPGHAFKPEGQPLAGEPIIGKHTHSAFIATPLEQHLRSMGCAGLVVVGADSSNSLDSTVRMSADLGFRTYLAADGTFTFEKQDWSGRMRTAEEVHDMSLANLSDEYCTIVTTSWILAQLSDAARPEQRAAVARTALESTSFMASA
jgi:nicotinamidase-related amidase